MNIEKINSAIKACFDAGKEKFVDIIFVGYKRGKNFIIVKDDKYASLIDAEEKEVLSNMEFVQERYFEGVYKDLESISVPLAVYKERSNLEIIETKRPYGISEFVVKMEAKGELKDDFIIRKLINDFFNDTTTAKG